MRELVVSPEGNMDQTNCTQGKKKKIPVHGRLNSKLVWRTAVRQWPQFKHGPSVGSVQAKTIDITCITIQIDYSSQLVLIWVHISHRYSSTDANCWENTIKTAVTTTGWKVQTSPLNSTSWQKKKLKFSESTWECGAKGNNFCLHLQGNCWILALIGWGRGLEF